MLYPGVRVRMQNVRANVKFMKFQSLCIFSCILTLIIILIKPRTTKAHDRRASGDGENSKRYVKSDNPIQKGLKERIPNHTLHVQFECKTRTLTESERASPRVCHFDSYVFVLTLNLNFDPLTLKYIGIFISPSFIYVWNMKCVKTYWRVRTKVLTKLKSSLDLLIPKCISIFLSPSCIHIWNMKAVRWKLLKLLCQNQNVDKVQLWPWPLTFWPQNLYVSSFPYPLSVYEVWNL